MIFLRATKREFAHAAAGVFVALFAILITTVLIRLLGQAAGGRVPADAVVALIGFGALAQMPVVLSLTAFIAVLLSLSRSYRDSEMVIWFASGMPLTAFIRPVLHFGLPVVAVIAVMSLLITPWANLKNEEFRAQLDSRDDTTRVAPGVFRESVGAQRVFFVESGADEQGRLRNVFVASEQNGRIDVVASANGSIHVDPSGDRFVVLDQGSRYEGGPGSAAFKVLDFERYSILIESRRAVGQVVRSKTTSTVDLIKGGTDRQMAEFAGRIGAPVAALLLVLMAIPMSFVNPRAGRGYNMIFAILIYLVYSNAINVCQAWVSQGRLRFELGLVLPHLIMLVVLGLMFYRRLAVAPFFRSRGAQ
ncbi:MAG: LPS export ABC transporter permease LptF [Rhodocyclales bacterium]|nr:LPS export ABC transporter permease LptF [Rhodocyclales bacterium]